VEAVEFKDNLLDFVPGDEQIVIANGLNGRAVNWRFYGTSIIHTQGK
jgi:beta-mannosidase